MWPNPHASPNRRPESDAVAAQTKSRLPAAINRWLTCSGASAVYSQCMSAHGRGLCRLWGGHRPVVWCPADCRVGVGMTHRAFGKPPSPSGGFRWQRTAAEAEKQIALSNCSTDTPQPSGLDATVRFRSLRGTPLSCSLQRSERTGGCTFRLPAPASRFAPRRWFQDQFEPRSWYRAVIISRLRRMDSLASATSWRKDSSPCSSRAWRNHSH